MYFARNKTTIILAMVGECTFTKNHPHGTHVQWVGASELGGWGMVASAKTQNQNVVKQRDDKWQVCLRDCVHSRPLIKSLS